MATTPPNSGAGAPQPAGSSPPGSAGQPPQQLAPEQIQQMELIVQQCMSLVLEQQTMEMIVAKAKQGQPARVLADVVAPLLKQVYEAAAGAGAQVDMLVLLGAGIIVLGKLSEGLFQADVVATEQEAMQVAAQAGKLAVDMHNASVGQQPGQPAPGGAQPQAGGGMLQQGV